MTSTSAEIREARTIRYHAEPSLGWVVLVTEEHADAMPWGVPAQLTHSGLSVLEVIIARTSARPLALQAVRDAASMLEDLPRDLPVLFGGVGRGASLAAVVAADVDAPGLVSIDGALLSVAWRLPQWTSPVLLLSSTGARMASRLALRGGNMALGRQARVAKGDLGSAAADQSIREWRRAAANGAWPELRMSPVRRLAAPAAAVMALGGSATLLAGNPVAASQRSGDGVAALAVPSSHAMTLGGVKVRPTQRRGDGLRSHATGSKSLIDNAGLKWFVNTDITFSTTSSASGAMSNASYTGKVAASTLNGGTAQSTLTNSYNGYNSLIVSVNGTLCTATGQAGCSYDIKNGPATLSCNGREVNIPMKVMGGLNVTRRVFVPTDDHFERTLNVFNNPTASPITATVAVANNLGSDTDTKITGTSAGGTTISDSDAWVTTFKNFTGTNTTTSDPRLGHVLQNAGASVPASHVTFSNGHNTPTWFYTFTVNPGETKIIGNFAVADGSIAASMADSARLAALPPTSLECMSPSDLSELANFQSAPSVTTQPTNVGIASGATATFNAQATAVGIGQVTVKWQVSTDGGATFHDLSGQTSNTLSLTNVPLSNNGDQYRAVFTDGTGSTNSLAATLVVASTGYWLTDATGGVYSFGVPFHGSLPGLDIVPNAPIVGLTATPDGGGYWLVGADGGVYSFGDARFHGSAGGIHLNKPIVGMAATPDGGGYWLVASDGGVFSFGNARFHGSAGAVQLNNPIVGMAVTPDGGGYWLVASDGGVFSYGTAVFHRSLGGQHLNKPIVGIAPSPDGGGYWLAGADGGVFNFGNARFFGSSATTPLNKPIVGIVPTPDGGGYREIAADGGVFDFGNALFRGSTGGQPPARPVTGLDNG